jgi:UDP-glucose 4-epimerase
MKGYLAIEMRILITGASGRIGRFLAASLASDHIVTGLDVQSGPYTNVLGSITDRNLVKELCSHTDAVIHAAALHAPHVGVVSDRNFHETNVVGTRLLLEASLHSSVKRFVYTSTTSLYGKAMIPKDRAAWVTEDLVPQGRDIYDETKIAAEAECRQAAQVGLHCISLRISRCFPEPEQLMAIYRLYRGVDLHDVVQAHKRALLSDLEGFHVFNISALTLFNPGDTQELINDARKVILKYHPWAGEAFARRGWQLPASIDRVYAINKAQEQLGYEPQRNFESLFK